MMRAGAYSALIPMSDPEELLRRTLLGEAEAWRALQATLHPEIAAIARRHRELRDKGLVSPDDVAEIAITTLERLARDDFRNLRDMLEKRRVERLEAKLSFDAWLYGTTDFVIREHLRKRYGRAPKQAKVDSERPRPSKRDLQSHAGRIDDDQLERSLLESAGMTTRLTLAEVHAFVTATFDALEVRALRLHFAEERTFEEIAAQLGLLDAKEAERMIRRLNARLRYHFAQAAGS